MTENQVLWCHYLEGVSIFFIKFINHYKTHARTRTSVTSKCLIFTYKELSGTQVFQLVCTLVDEHLNHLNFPIWENKVNLGLNHDGTVTEIELYNPEEGIMAQMYLHEHSTKGKSMLRQRGAQRCTCRGAPSDSDTASESEADVSTWLHTWRKSHSEFVFKK